MEHELGEYIYMGMGTCNGETVNMSTAYKPDYCVKKALQFETASNGVVIFKKMHTVRVGELTRGVSTPRSELQEQYQHIFQEIL